MRRRYGRDRGTELNKGCIRRETDRLRVNDRWEGKGVRGQGGCGGMNEEWQWND